jgi:hypothetical protein
VVLRLAPRKRGARRRIDAVEQARKVDALRLPVMDRLARIERSTRPTISATVRKPISAMIARSSSATKKK